MLRSILLTTGLLASIAASAASATYGDYAMLSCKSTTLKYAAFSASYDSGANNTNDCAVIMKNLGQENMLLSSTNTTDNSTIVYTFSYFAGIPDASK